MSLIGEIRQLFGSDAGRGVLGQRVFRAAVDWGAGAGGRTILFTIAGGEIYTRCIYCVCTTGPAAGAQTVLFDCTPTAGTGVNVMDNGVGDINGILVGAIIAPQGNLALPAVVAGPLCGGPTMSRPWICATGTIGVTCGGAFDHGNWDLIMYYVPLTIGAAVT